MVIRSETVIKEEYLMPSKETSAKSGYSANALLI